VARVGNGVGLLLLIVRKWEGKKEFLSKRNSPLRSGLCKNLCRIDYVVMIFCKLSNGKQRYVLKENRDVDDKLHLRVNDFQFRIAVRITI
jgi:hypothetical protein